MVVLKLAVEVPTAIDAIGLLDRLSEEGVNVRWFSAKEYVTFRFGDGGTK